MSPRPDRRPFGPGPYLLAARPGDEAPVDEFPFTLPAVAAVERMRFDGPVTFLVGENGSGKSTLIESLARTAKFPGQGGTLSGELGWSSPDEMGLGDELEVDRGPNKPRAGFFLRAESFFNVASRIDRQELSGIYGGTDLHHQSHGESFIALASNRFGGDSLFILDEPKLRCRSRAPSPSSGSCTALPARDPSSSWRPTHPSSSPCPARGYTSWAPTERRRSRGRTPTSFA